MTNRVAAAVLAAGRGERFGGDAPKPLAHLGGRSLVSYAIAAAHGSGLAPIVIAVANDEVAALVPEDPDFVVARNPTPEAGISSSMQTVLRALDDHEDVDGVVIGLSDQPLVGPEAYRRVGAAYHDGARLAVATYGGVRGNPVLVARSHWPEALALAGDEGARVLLRRHGAIEVPCDGAGDPTDVDTPEDLAALEARWRSQTASE